MADLGEGGFSRLGSAGVGVDDVFGWDGPAPPIPPKSERRDLRSPFQSPCFPSGQSGSDTKASSSSQPQTREERASVRRSRSLARVRSLNRIGATKTGSPGTPTRVSTGLVKRAGRGFGASAAESLASSPGLTAAVERQFGAVSQPAAVSANDDKENIPAAGKGGSVGSGGACTDGTGLTGPVVDAQVLGSKRMVDLFLNSRRQRMVSSEDTSAFV